MKVAVFGHHPDLFPGFNALMTANLAYGFSERGYMVTVFLPETISHPQSTRMSALNLSVETLDQFGAEIEFRTIKLDENFGSYDLGIWQSYFADDEAFFPAFRRSVKAVAKNFPRCLTGNRKRDIHHLAGMTNRFDIVGFSLKSDRDLAIEMKDAIPNAVAKSIYMPRGFRSDWFDQPILSGVPVFGIEKGVGSDSSEYAYLVPVITRLRLEFGRIDIIGARFNEPSITTSTVGLLPARKFYEQFLNPLWGYLMIDINKSRQSMNSIKVGDKTVYLGLYENQVIEAQLAGASVIGHEDCLPQELISSNQYSLRFKDYSDTQEIFNFLASVIENRSIFAHESSKWAQSNHSISNMIQPLVDKL